VKNVTDYINYSEILSTIWTIIFIPILTWTVNAIGNNVKDRKIDQYQKILYVEVKKSVKSVYENYVKHIKGTDQWTDESKQYVEDLAKTKTLQALPSKMIKALKDANPDLDSYIHSLIHTALYDLKHEGRI